MTTETPKPKNDGGTVKPDNWHSDSTTEPIPDVLLADGGTETKPDNWHSDSEPLK
ncbi:MULTISPECIES: hypothetical protein [unclassified Streptomyces]|uniref:hypothetical protein n=1 Tax=unclassified Streptomyces TaxID=2593676 RepID=UPI0020340A7C|nr:MULTISPECIES: hypothetical protein [unclassified Streptomyces]MCM2419906.1 hypothetical protein [Streptomyces sp. RKAG293]MCM2427909.1 hypothetical protein [Streptomyces sp. RKAG337]